jgi:hypothetical protein
MTWQVGEVAAMLTLRRETLIFMRVRDSGRAEKRAAKGELNGRHNGNSLDVGGA